MGRNKIPPVDLVEIWQPESVSARAWTIGIEPVGLMEIADRLRKPRPTFEKLRQRGQFPPPVWMIGGSAAWNWPHVLKWVENRHSLFATLKPAVIFEYFPDRMATTSANGSPL